MIRCTVLASVLIISMLCLSACGKKAADEEQIKLDLESDTKFQFLKNDEQIDEIIIEKRQTEKEQKTDTVWCTVVTSNAEASCQKDIVLTYGLYDKTGWILDRIDVSAKDEWVMTPLKGVEESSLSTLLLGQIVNIDNEEWQIAQDNLLNAKIEEQYTNLEQKTDQIVISLTLDDKLERADGKIKALFTFNQEWKFDSFISQDYFTVSMKEEYALNVTENDLISKLTETELPISDTKQTILINEQEISDFKIEEQTAESKGSRQLYRCSYQVSKSKVTIAMESLIVYDYRDGEGWQGSENNTTSQIVSTDIIGNWSGTYINGFREETAELQISEVNDDGSVKAVFAFAEGSYELSGTWNREELKLQLEAGDWIEEPAKIRISNDKDSITGELKLEKDRLEASTRQGFIYFTLME